jgi:hypothetical protein
MKLFPGLFYIACVVLLGVRLRPLQHPAPASMTSTVWWQREFDLWVGWAYKLLTALVTWLYKCSTTIPPTTTASDSGNPHIPLWRHNERLKSAFSQCTSLSGCLYAPVAAAFNFSQIYLAAQTRDQMKEKMVSLGYFFYSNVLSWIPVSSLFNQPNEGTSSFVNQRYRVSGNGHICCSCPSRGLDVHFHKRINVNIWLCRFFHYHDRTPTVVILIVPLEHCPCSLSPSLTTLYTDHHSLI